MAHLRLDAKAQDELDRIGKPFQRGRRVLLFGEDEATDFALYLRKGYVKITVGSPDHIVGIRGPNEVVGEMAAVENKPRTASVYTITDLDAMLIPARAWLEFLEHNWTFTRSVLELQAARLRELTGKHAELGQLAIEQRVARRLIELGTIIGERSDKGLSVEITQAELAGWAGTARETVSQLMKKFRQEGIVETQRQRIIVSDWTALNDIADGQITTGALADDDRVNDDLVAGALRHGRHGV